MTAPALTRSAGQKRPAGIASPRTPTPQKPEPASSRRGGAARWLTPGTITRFAILGGDGNHLARARGYLATDRTTVVIERVSDPAALLHYYFVNCGRPVKIQIGTGSRAGSLATRWNGTKRDWLVRLGEAECQPAADASEAFARSAGTPETHP